MPRSRIVQWLLDEALPAIALAAGYALVPDMVDGEAPSLRTQLADILGVVAREERRWAAQDRIGEKR